MDTPLFSELIAAQVGGISAQAAALLNGQLALAQKPKGQLLVRQGQVATRLYFLVTGSCRYYATKGSQEVTTWFGFSNEFVTPYISFFKQQPSYESIELMEDSSFFKISHHKLQQLRQQSAEVERIVNHFNMAYTIQLEERLFVLQTSTAKEKYQHMLTQHPQLVQRIPSKHLASYLGITRETLSRMRAELRLPG